MTERIRTATKSTWRSSFLLGLAGAVLIAGLHLLGLDNRAELLALNLRFRYHSQAESLDGIVNIDIDDGSLEALGRWPWPRETLAGVVESLQACGAGKVVLDIILPTPQQVRYVNPAAEVSRWDRSSRAVDTPPGAVFDDAILAKTIRQGCDVFVPMHVAISAQPPAKAEFSAGLLNQNPDMSFAEFREKYESANRTAATKLDIDVKKLSQIYLRRRAILALERLALPSQVVAGLEISNSEMTPPVLSLGRAAYGSGFVTFVPDTDSMARRVQLLTRCDGKIYPQLAFAVALDVYKARHGPVSISAKPGQLKLRGADGAELSIPLDRAGAMLVNWARWSWLDQAGQVGPGHISAAYVAEVWLARRRLARLGDLAQLLRMRFLALGFPEDVLPPGDAEASHQLAQLLRQSDEIYKSRVRAEGQYLWSQLFDPAGAPDQAKALATLRQAEDDIEARLPELSARLVATLRKPETLKKFAPDAQAQARAKKILAQLDTIPDRKQKIQRRLAERVEKVSQRVAGKICFIGSTSTGAPDFVPTPISPRTPGVVVHANALGTILSERFIRQSSPAVNILAIMLAGALVSLLAARLPVPQAGASTVALAGAYYIINAFVLFGLWRYWLVMIAPPAAMLASFLVVTAYRQLTEERAKRHIRDMFAHALSPELVDKLLEDPSLAQLGGQSRRLSFVFSDLGGFTSLSEKLGAEETVRLLNRYFDRMTDVIQTRHGGYLNKFLGDGIFAFFGAPIFQTDHASRAIRSAVECLQAVAQLNEELAQEGYPAQLVVRIGVSTGEAMVGNCGSSQRMDYTAIGDNVNLAARLEAANKFFDSNILVDEETWLDGASAQTCDDDTKLLGRPMGRVYVTGQARPLWIWEIVGQGDKLDPKLRDALADFTRAIEFFKQRQYAQAAELLEACQQAMPDDKPTAIYLELSRQGQALPADKDPTPAKSGAKGVDRIALPWE